MSILWSSRVWEEATGIKGTNLLVLLCLADHAQDETGLSWPSLARIAERARCSERTVQRALDALVEKGWLTVEQRPGQSSHYYVRTPDTLVRGDNLSGVTPVTLTPDTHVVPPTTTVSSITINEPSYESSSGLVEFPTMARPYVLSREAEEWTALYRSMHALAVEAKPIESLMAYLHWCHEKKRKPTTEGAMRWFVKDQRDIRQAVTAERDTGPSEPKPWWDC